MTDNSGKYIFVNGLTYEYNNENNDVNNLLSLIEDSTDIIARIYEVVRFIDGVPLFWEEHVDRLIFSLSTYLESHQIDLASLRADCCSLVKECGLVNCNIQITFYINNHQIINKIIYVKKHFYPSKEMYNNGVDTDVVYINRDMPNVKNWIPEYKQAVKEAMGNNFEILLTNDNNEILEGSRSNFFYVKGDTVYTSPQKFVLNGITRINVLRAIEKCGFPVVEKSLAVSELANIDGAFLSGTSLNVLPIRRIGTVEFFENNRLHSVIYEIMLSFEKLLREYLENNKDRDNYSLSV